MQTSISATEAVRHFSELLNNIRYKGDRYTVIRGGKPAAVLAPVEPMLAGRTLGDLREIFRLLPRLDQEDTTFADDVMAVVQSQPAMPEGPAWE
jgi:prevent-host-death family protein